MRGQFGVGVYRPKVSENVGTLWRAAHLYGASHLFTVGARYQRQASDTSKAWQSVPAFAYDDADDFLTHRPFDMPLVAVELSDRAVPLGRFEHPERAVYLLGAEDHGLPPWLLDRCEHVVQVETAQPWSMNVAMAGSLVMYSRHLQRAGVPA